MKRAPKVHCNSPVGYGVQPFRRDGLFPIHHDGSRAAWSICGAASLRVAGEDKTLHGFREGITIPLDDFAMVPVQAQCGRCRRIAVFNQHLPADACSATSEVITTVEAFLHVVVRAFEVDHTWFEQIPIYSYRG